MLNTYTQILRERLLELTQIVYLCNAFKPFVFHE